MPATTRPTAYLLGSAAALVAAPLLLLALGAGAAVHHAAPCIGTDPGEACADLPLASTGMVTYPVPAALAGTDRHNWGGRGDHWTSWHTGTDFSVPCRTPVLASTGGTVEVATGPDWYGSWLVKIVTGPTSVATWYAHMQQLTVRPGQVVTA